MKYILKITIFLSVFGMTLTGCEEKKGWGPYDSVAFRNAELKIVQLTDLHYVVGSQESAGSLERIARILDTEQPDMVVITGDIVLCDSMRQGWDEVLDVIVSRQIPWAAVLGNHDDEYTWTREQIMDYICDKPYSMTRKGPEDITGLGNYIITVNNSAGTPSALLYLMDSNAYSTIKGVRGYGWFEFDQIEWYRSNSAWFTSGNEDRPLPALAFFHIPFIEYLQMATIENAPLIGTRDEKECPPAVNTGMFAAMLKAGDVMCTFAGHDHNNDYIGQLNGIGLAYGRFSGGATVYTDIGYGARVIVMKEGARSFETWIRTGDGEKIDFTAFPL